MCTCALLGNPLSEREDGRVAEVRVGEGRHLPRRSTRDGEEPHAERLLQAVRERGDVGDEAGEGLGARVAGEGDGVQADAADGARSQQVADAVPPSGRISRQPAVLHRR